MRDGPVSAPGSPRLLPVIANQCVGALQRVSLCGERSPKGALLPPGLQTAGSMADFGATRCGNPRLRREAWQAGTTSGKFVYAFPYSPKVFPFTLCCCKENGLPRRFAPRNDMQKHAGWGCIIPGAAGILPENAPATVVPEQISAYPSRQTPLHPRTRPSFCMSLRTSAHTGVAIRSPRRETWQGGGSLGEFVTPYEFAQSTAVFCALLRGYGLPRRFAPRHDMQKHAGWLHNTGRCRYTAGKRPCNRSPGASFRAPLAPNAPAPAILAPWPAVEGGPGPAKNSAPWTHRNVY